MLEEYKPKNHPIARIKEEITSMIHRFFDDSFFNSQTKTFMPSINLREDEEKFIVETELPGIDMKDIDIEIHGNKLTIKGEKRIEKENKEGKNHIIESQYGSFYRTFTIPDHVDTDKISAESKNGIVYIYLPKDKTNGPKRIDIRRR